MGLFGSSENEVSEEVESILADARHDSVTAERLTKLKPGRMSRYLYDDPLIEYLEEGEQPHFVLAARTKTPTAEGADAPAMPEQSGTGMVMHLITDRRWLTVAANSNGDETLSISFEELTDVDCELGGHGTHELQLGVDGARITVPIANIYDDEDVDAARSYLEERVPDDAGDVELEFGAAADAGEVGTPSENDGSDETPDDASSTSDEATDSETNASDDSSAAEEPPDDDSRDEESTDDGSTDEAPSADESSSPANDRADTATTDDGEEPKWDIDDEDYEVIEEYLDADERPHYLLKGASISIEGGNSQDRKGSLTGTVRTAVTDRRVLTVIPQKLMGEDTKSVPYEEMGGIDFNKGLMNKYLKFQSHGRTYKIHTRNTDRTKAAMKYIRRRKQELEEESQSSSDNGADPIEQLKNLKELHDQGVLSDDEFEEKKSELLDRI